MSKVEARKVTAHFLLKKFEISFTHGSSVFEVAVGSCIMVAVLHLVEPNLCVTHLRATAKTHEFESRNHSIGLGGMMTKSVKSASMLI